MIADSCPEDSMIHLQVPAILSWPTIALFFSAVTCYTGILLQLVSLYALTSAGVITFG